MKAEDISAFIGGWRASPFGDQDRAAWAIVQLAETLIADAALKLDDGFRYEGGFAIHGSSTVEPGATLKGAGIIGPRCFVAAGAQLRGGIYLAEDCTIGPGCELKSSFLFSGSRLAHLNFVGDSIIGSDVNIEAGAIIANHRNELTDKNILILHGDEVIDTGVTKFGSLVGDGARIGANAVIAPGALIAPNSIVGRLQLIDQHPDGQLR